MASGYFAAALYRTGGRPVRQVRNLKSANAMRYVVSEAEQHTATVYSMLFPDRCHDS